ncbi:MAG TPA: ATP-binding protein, partial [Burkholderiaceae bacterium]
EHPLIDGSAALTVDPAILAWLEEAAELDRCLAGRARALEPDVELPGWQLDALAQRVADGLRQGARWRVHLRSDDRTACEWLAAGLALRLRLPVLGLRAGAVVPDATTALRLHRQAWLDDCVPCVALEDEALSRPPGVLPYPLQVVHGTGALPPAAAVNDIVHDLPPPDAAERDALWRRLCPASAAWDAAARADLALCHESTIDDIATVAAAAPASARDASDALRERSRADLAPLAYRVQSRFQWQDLVVAAPLRERLQQLAFEARERARLWSEPAAARLFPYGRGLVALFAGPPGTGKTMAAQVLAADLGLDLLAVDLSAVVSKWVGETSRHLQSLLSSRAAQGAILFFDEADALFAKRVEETRDAQDRYANLDSSHLMTALENYPGIALLASNLKASIDPAFMRRVRHVIDFQKPDAAAREELWRQVLDALFTPGQFKALADDLPRLARIEATGAVIKNAALSAAFAARQSGAPTSVQALGDALAVELAKHGAGLSPRELRATLEAAS